MQMMLTYVPLVFAVIGAFVIMFGYYLGLTCRESCAPYLLAGTSLVLATVCYFIGILIQKLSLSSYTDFLTGLWNRRFFYSKIDNEKAWATRKKTPLCVALIDVDDFKTINDTYGHAAGDLLLVELASIFKKGTRDTDTVIRWGGDEFAIIFVDTALANAFKVMDRIRQEIEEKFSASCRITISAGIIQLKPDEDIKDLLIKVDHVLYRAKNKKNLVTSMADM